MRVLPSLDEYGDWSVALFITQRSELGGIPLFNSWAELARIIAEDSEYPYSKNRATIIWHIEGLAKGRRSVACGLIDAVMRAVASKHSNNPQLALKLASLHPPAARRPNTYLMARARSQHESRPK